MFPLILALFPLAVGLWIFSSKSDFAQLNALWLWGILLFINASSFLSLVFAGIGELSK